MWSMYGSATIHNINAIDCCHLNLEPWMLWLHWEDVMSVMNIRCVDYPLCWLYFALIIHCVDYLLRWLSIVLLSIALIIHCVDYPLRWLSIALIIHCVDYLLRWLSIALIIYCVDYSVVDSTEQVALSSAAVFTHIWEYTLIEEHTLQSNLIFKITLSKSQPFRQKLNKHFLKANFIIADNF
jgi:hypothetical protein